VNAAEAGDTTGKQIGNFKNSRLISRRSTAQALHSAKIGCHSGPLQSGLGDEGTSV
jgi:hypothetical protein